MDSATPLTRYRRALVGSLVLLVGCATSTRPAPSPPLVAEDLDTGQEYQWTPFRWNSGKRLTYRMQLHSELAAEGHTRTAASDMQLSFVGAGQTANGLTQVAVSGAGGGIEGGSLLIDETGRVRDVLAVTN